MSYVLGISCFYHDSSASLILNGKVVCAAEEERFTRSKHDNSFPLKSIQFCLDQAGICPNQIDAFVFYENPILKFDRVFRRFIVNMPKSLKILKHFVYDWHEKRFWFKEILSKKFNISRKKIFFSKHHESHASSSFFPSNFKESAFLTIDGVGEWETLTSGHVSNGKFKKNNSINFPHSLGILYSAFTEFLGFEVNEGEFKVMGMAAYGKPRYLDKIEKIFLTRNSKNFELNLDFFSFEYDLDTNLSKKFISLFGSKRVPESVFFLEEENEKLKYKLIPLQQYYADIAASIQEILKEQVVAICKNLNSEINSQNLCYSGGVALNGVVNSEIMKHSGFKNIYIQPASGDSGTSLGCALNFYNSNIASICPDVSIMDGVYLGKNYDEKHILKVLANYSFKYYKYDQNNKLIEQIVSLLIKQKVGAICRGRFEFGPRALGNRSIIADPRKNKMKYLINKSVKFREVFRPFAPVVIDKYANKYFNLDEFKTNLQPFEYMLAVAKVRSEFRDNLQCITHVDGTARVQILKYCTNEFFYQLIESFGLSTGIFSLVNTSFNLRGEPMVASPEDALRTFAWSNLEFLVLENYLILKN